MTTYTVEKRLKDAVEASFQALVTDETIASLSVSVRGAAIDLGAMEDDTWNVVLCMTETAIQAGLGIYTNTILVLADARKRYSVDIDLIAPATVRQDADIAKQFLDRAARVYGGDETFCRLAQMVTFRSGAQLDSDQIYGDHIIVAREYEVTFDHDGSDPTLVR